MIKKNLIKILILLFFLSGCGYSPIFSKKNTNFSIYELKSSGNNKLNKIINSRLNNYKGSDGAKKYSITIETNLNKKEALEIFEMVKEIYSSAPNTFGSAKGKKEDALEMLMIISDQISKEYKDCEVIWRQGVPEITKVKDL